MQHTTGDYRFGVNGNGKESILLGPSKNFKDGKHQRKQRGGKKRQLYNDTVLPEAKPTNSARCDGSTSAPTIESRGGEKGKDERNPNPSPECVLRTSSARRARLIKNRIN